MIVGKIAIAMVGKSRKGLFLVPLELMERQISLSFHS